MTTISTTQQPPEPDPFALLAQMSQAWQVRENREAWEKVSEWNATPQPIVTPVNVTTQTH